MSWWCEVIITIQLTCSDLEENRKMMMTMYTQNTSYMAWRSNRGVLIAFFLPKHIYAQLMLKTNLRKHIRRGFHGNQIVAFELILDWSELTVALSILSKQVASKGNYINPCKIRHQIQDNKYITDLSFYRTQVVRYTILFKKTFWLTILQSGY